MTQEHLLDAIVAEIKELFSHGRPKNSLGIERAVSVYAQDVPIREADDEGEEKSAPPEPYVIVRVSGAKTQDESAPQMVSIVLVVCVYDANPDRQGFRDALHIVNELYRHYTTNGVIGGRYVVRYPIEWAAQEDDTHPYYFCAMTLNVEAPSMRKETPYL